MYGPLTILLGANGRGRVVKGMGDTSLGPRSHAAWTWESSLSLTSCVTLDMLLYLFKSHFFHL